MVSNEPSALPHDDYMRAVANVLAGHGFRSRWWTETPDGVDLHAVFRDWPADSMISDEWANGVYLAWNPADGWILVEDGGSRTIWPLSEDSYTFSDPKQVGMDAFNRLIHGPTGWTPGPICMTHHWDTEPTRLAVEKWLQSAAEGAR
jgi:hypothetical protein